MQPASDTQSDQHLLQRVKWGLLIMLAVFAVHTILPGIEYWPLQRWRMFSGSSDLTPTETAYYLQIQTADGSVVDLYSPQLGYIADRVVAGAVGPADSPDLAAYRTMLVYRLRTALPDIVPVGIEVWLNTYAVAYDIVPPFDIQAPTTSEYRGHIELEGT